MNWKCKLFGHHWVNQHEIVNLRNYDDLTCSRCSIKKEYDEFYPYFFEPVVKFWKWIEENWGWMLAVILVLFILIGIPTLIILNSQSACKMIAESNGYTYIYNMWVENGCYLVDKSGHILPLDSLKYLLNK